MLITFFPSGPPAVLLLQLLLQNPSLGAITLTPWIQEKMWTYGLYQVISGLSPMRASLMHLEETPREELLHAQSSLRVDPGEGEAGRTTSRRSQLTAPRAARTGSVSLPFSNSTAPPCCLPHPQLQHYCLQKWKQGTDPVENKPGKKEKISHFLLSWVPTNSHA